MKLIIAVISILVAAPALLVGQVRNENTRCNYTRRMACGSGGCAAKQSEMFLLLPASVSELVTPTGDTPAIVQRCDNAGCTDVPVVAFRSGAFVEVVSPGSGYLLKLQATDVFGEGKGDFVEVATSLLAAMVSYGSCTGIRD